MTLQIVALQIKSRNESKAGLSIAAIAFFLVVCTTQHAVSWLTGMWLRDEYSHSWLILPLATLIFINRYPTIHQSGGKWVGVLVSCLAIFMMITGWAIGSYSFSIYSAILSFLGLIVSFHGVSGAKKLLTPVVYLMFIVPLPLALYLTISSDMQLIASKFGVFMASLVGVDAVLDGNIIDLGMNKLDVAEACSGLRYLFPLISFGFLIATLLHDKVWKKIILLISAVPIAIVLNSIRIAAIAFLVSRFGIGMASGPQHEFEGFFVFAICIVLLLGEVWVLLRIGRTGRFLLINSLIPGRLEFLSILRWPLSGASFAAGVVLSVGSLVVVALPVRSEIIPVRQSLYLFPLEFGAWSGAPLSLDQTSIGMLNLTDYILANFQLKDGGANPVNFYVAYYSSQRLGIHAHSPQLCIPGGGWNVNDMQDVEVRELSGEVIDAKRVLIEKDGVKQLVYYWFEERGRHISSESSLKYFSIRDQLLRNRSDGALVRLVSPVRNGNVDEADRSILLLMQAVLPIMTEYVPK